MSELSYKVTPVETGEFSLDGGAMFGVVPKVIWEKLIPADSKNRIPLRLRCFLIQGRDRNILIDTGIGEHWNEKTRNMFSISNERFNIDSSLKKFGLTREDITEIIISHLHFDHVGGATMSTSKGKIELTFPSATYYIQSLNLNHAHAPTEKDRASFIEHTIKPLEQSGKLKKIDGFLEIYPGIEIVVTHGHTPGHQMVRIRHRSATILFTGDTIPTASHIPIPYVMAYDLEPQKTMAEKRSILSAAFEKKWILAFVHDPNRAFGTVKMEGEKFLLDQSFDIIPE